MKKTEKHYLSEWQESYDEANKLVPVIEYLQDGYKAMVKSGNYSDKELKSFRRRVRYITTSYENWMLLLKNWKDEIPNWLKESVN